MMAMPDDHEVGEPTESLSADDHLAIYNNSLKGGTFPDFSVNGFKNGGLNGRYMKGGEELQYELPDGNPAVIMVNNANAASPVLAYWQYYKRHWAICPRFVQNTDMVQYILNLRNSGDIALGMAFFAPYQNRWYEWNDLQKRFYRASIMYSEGDIDVQSAPLQMPGVMPFLRTPVHTGFSTPTPGLPGFRTPIPAHIPVGPQQHILPHTPVGPPRHILPHTPVGPPRHTGNLPGTPGGLQGGNLPGTPGGLLPGTPGSLQARQIDSPPRTPPPRREVPAASPPKPTLSAEDTDEEAGVFDNFFIKKEDPLKEGEFQPGTETRDVKPEDVNAFVELSSHHMADNVSSAGSEITYDPADNVSAADTSAAAGSEDTNPYLNDDDYLDGFDKPAALDPGYVAPMTPPGFEAGGRRRKADDDIGVGIKRQKSGAVAFTAASAVTTVNERPRPSIASWPEPSA